MRYEKIEFDRLQMYFGEPYVVDVESANGTLTLLQPKIGDIVRIGEKRFYQTLNVFIVNTTSYRLPLWDMGKDWNLMSDYELFLLLLPSVDQVILDLLFDNLKLENLTLDTENLIIKDIESEVEINEEVYHHISQYFRSVFNTFPEEKLTKDNMLKEWMIRKDRAELKNAEEKRKKGTEASNSLQAIISACINHPGFKYDMHSLVNVGVCEFYDSVQRLQVYEQSTALMKGLYSGFVDSKSIRPEAYNFMKEI